MVIRTMNRYQQWVTAIIAVVPLSELRPAIDL